MERPALDVLCGLLLMDAPAGRVQEPIRPFPPTTIALLIDRLGYGGAERQFVVLAKALQQDGHSVMAIVFYAGGALEAELRGAGVTPVVIGKRGRWDLVRFTIRLARVLRRGKPRVLLSYAGVANLFAVALKPLLRGTRIVWGVRASNMDLRRYGLVPRTLGRLSAALSRFPDLIIANSTAGRLHAVAMGYPPARIVVVPNGIDTSRFVPSLEGRQTARRAWGIGAEETVVGLVGRLDPMKDHPTFLAAAAIVARGRDDVRFVCVGDGPMAYREALHARSAELGLDGRVSWIPAQAQMTDVYNALDILCSSSAYGEGFPNVLGEAMACGVPCVVTAVGDSAEILGQPRFTVRSGDAGALAERLGELLDSPPAEIARMTDAARRRIDREFSIANLVRATGNALAAVADGSSR